MPMTANGLAKLIEECGELIQVAGKKLAYYTTNDHPDGGPPLNVRLEDEIADVMAAAFLVVGQLGLDRTRIEDRRLVKGERFATWHRQLDNNTHGIDAPTSAGDPT